jgi:hypothetical protein
MKKIRKVYLPKWPRWFLMPLLALILAMMAYMQFWDTNPDEKLPVPVFIILSVVIVGIAVMMWLMTSGKLPTYYIEEDDDER